MYVTRGICIAYCTYSTVFLHIDSCIYHEFPADVIYAWNDKDHEKWYEKSQLHID